LDYPEAQRLFLYRGCETLVVDSILCLPCEDFLRQLKGPTFLKIEPSFTHSFDRFCTITCTLGCFSSQCGTTG
jgi:hypothetical protein